MHPGRIIRAGRKPGFRCLGVYPHASDLYISLYRKHHGGGMNRLFRIPGMRSLAAAFSIFVYKAHRGDYRPAEIGRRAAP